MLGKLNSHIQKNETGLLSYTTPKISSKWIKNLNVIPEAIKLSEEKMAGGRSLTFVSAVVFLDLTPKSKATKSKYPPAPAKINLPLSHCASFISRHCLKSQMCQTQAYCAGEIESPGLIPDSASYSLGYMRQVAKPLWS